MKSLLIAGVVVSVLAVTGMWMGVRRLQAQTSVPGIYPFFPQVLTLGMVGLAPGQTARLYALNLPGCCALARPTQIQPVPCNMTLSFMDDQGATLKTAAMNIDSGKAVHLDLAHDDVTHDSSRLQIRGVVLQTVTVPPPITTPGLPVAFGCSVAPTLEIFDSATGVTTVVLESAKGLPTILPLGGIAPTP